MSDLMTAAWYVMRVAWRTGPLALVFTFGEVISTALRFLQPLMVGLIVDGVAGHSAGRAIWGTAVLVASLAFGGAAEALAVGHRVKLIEDVGYAFDVQIMDALSRIRELDRLEQPQLATAIAKVSERADTMGFCFNGLMAVIIQATAPIVSVCVAVTIDPRLLILTLAGFPTILVARKTAQLQADADEEAQPHASRALAWARLLADPDARAERKVFRLWQWYSASIRAAVSGRDRAFFRPASIESVGSFLADLFYLACAAAALLWILATGSHVAAGDVAAALLVSLDLRGTLGALRFALSDFGPSLRTAVALREVRDAASSTSGKQGPAASQPEPGGYRLTNVSYVYPQSKSAALRELNLLIQPGQVVAIVGANGAGKSTLVEMLLGLRRPTSGQAEIGDAVPSLIAQHFARFQFKLAEAVSLENLTELGSAETAKVRDSLRKATVRQFWQEHHDGIALQLGSQWPAGTDLSAGQLQAIAAARCFYVDEASLIVLDEPTAALDPEAQDIMARRYSAIALDVATRGGTAVLITHRMSMPRLADHIIVLRDGEIAETGTHDELIAANGQYAHAYYAQAAGFMELASEGP